MRLIPSCDDLARAAADGSYEEGPWWDRVRLTGHKLVCYVCRRYIAQLRWIDRAAASLWGAPADDDLLKARIKARLTK
jgi:hypothetical protein